MIFALYEEPQEDSAIKDPETGASLGPIPQEKLRVKVFDVFPKFSRAQTYRTSAPFDSLSFTIFPKDRIAVEGKSRGNKPNRQEAITVNIGDLVKHVDTDRDF
ncbi:hypothetical protein CSW57_03510 [Williamsia muralis]|uniref:Uncharacterized protein n=2 Tax=Williamsia marianensis TaxID=85044 RepID=A0A2G3PRB0_WILMA|nr:hypothetical protein CSW57_03510 [Williamsia marianensis]